MKLTSTKAATNEQFEALKKGLNGFNEQTTGELKREQIASFIEDEQGQVHGGILAEINWGWVYVQGIWISDNLRLQGWGSKLLLAIETDAKAKGIKNIRLETTSFQALGFYLKQGFEVFGELADMPPGHTSYFLKKALN
ncbi:GNAT family N-acetyltransferase [Catenovulum sp. SM1970]|uniref:GNAT family N-acetyltransferase n=1 Tax=Marinifaba aquimaris TaxID=2741323 RepID=UPI0015722414|nr:GNAT family N-acetyltransferase [Marinifaba aquimaris]NTS76778.1 GNAT family N-acetyltransferase [Marinifaba aquimaris]